MQISRYVENIYLTKCNNCQVIVADQSCKWGRRLMQVKNSLTIFPSGCEPNTLYELDPTLDFPGVHDNITACCPTRTVYSSIVAFNFLLNCKYFD